MIWFSFRNCLNSLFFVVVVVYLFLRIHFLLFLSVFFSNMALDEFRLIYKTKDPNDDYDDFN